MADQQRAAASEGRNELEQREGTRGDAAAPRRSSVEKALRREAVDSKIAPSTRRSFCAVPVSVPKIERASVPEPSSLALALDSERAKPLETVLVLVPMILFGGVLPGLLGGAMYWVSERTRVLLLSPFGVDQSSGEPITIPNMQDTDMPLAYLKWAWFEDAVVFGYFPIMFSVLARFNRLESLAMAGVTLIGFGVGLVLRSTVDKTLWIILPFSAPSIGLKLVAPKSGLAMQALFQSICMLLGVILLTGYRLFETPTDTWRFVVAVIVFPFFRELIYGISRLSARRMLLKPSMGGRNVNKTAIWGIFLWPCVVGSLILRLRFQNFRDESTLYLAVSVQALFELAQRLTLEKRDRFLARVVSTVPRLFSLRTRVGPAQQTLQAPTAHTPRATAVLPLVRISKTTKRVLIHFDGGTEETLASDSVDTQASRKAVYAMFILGEIVAELVAILLVPVIYFLMDRTKLSEVELEQFQLMEHPFQDSFPMNRLLASTAFQLIAELVVDTAASAWEVSNGFPLLAVWSGRPRWTWSGILFLATFLGSAMTRALLKSDNSFEACRGRDICWCIVDATTNDTLSILAPGDSMQGAMIKSYCEFAYNETAGIPT